MFINNTKCFLQLALRNVTSANQQVRLLSTELTAALRPFYFAVHPDLFAQHPEQRNANENSLKMLSAHMQSLHEQKFQVLQTSKLMFYIRDDKADKRDSFRRIQMTLDYRQRDAKHIVKTLLELCNLPTDALKNIKTTSPSTFQQEPQSGTAGAGFRPGQDYEYGSQFAGFEYSFYKTKEENKKTLDLWLQENTIIARTRSNELAGLREEVEKLQKRVVKRLNLSDARYDCGWNFEHYRGCLKTLERMANMHEQHMAVLQNRIVVFAAFTGVSLEGHVMLFTGDVLNNWIDFIKNIPKHDAFLTKIPNYENTLSQVLRNIRIGRRKFMPKQQAKEYAGHLNKVTTTLGDYLTLHKFPKSWPESLNDFEIVIESEAGPLMVNPTGQLIAPATCPGFMLIDFISTNMAVAKERMEKYQLQKHVELELIQRCLVDLQLKSLTKDDSITPDKMIDALEALLLHECRPHLANIDLHIANYYSVLADGIVCIPWDFKFR